MELMPTGDVLATTLATEFVPASNLRGEAAGAAWRYLLPTMEPGRVLCVGRLPAPTLETLARESLEVTVVTSARDRVAGTAGDRVHRVAETEAEVWLAGRPDGSLDLVWLGGGAGGAARGVRTAVAGSLARLLAAGGVVIREHRGRPERGDGSGTTPTADGAGRRTAWVVVRPDDGEIRSAVADGDAAAAQALAIRKLDGPAVRPRFRTTRRVNAVVDRVAGRRLHRRLEISLPPGTSTMPDPPDYLVACAADDGVDLRDWSWALSATGVYNTQKVLGLLMPPGVDEPAMVVKMTRDATVVPRLENERDALRRLATLGMAADDRIPLVRFAGRHAGLAVVGELALRGHGFRAAGEGHGLGPGPADAVDWLTDLATRSARPAAAADVAAALSDLYRRFVALCGPEDAVARPLESAIATIGASPNAVPLVFQHGDPGTWNLLQREDGTVAFLDWENADPAGMPLWDLFYLLRSLAVGAGRRSRTRRRLAAVDRYLFDESPLSDFFVGSIERYADRVGLDRSLIEPLFHACWMHQALKEATRVAPGRVRSAHYNRLLRRGLERRSAPNLRRMFEGSA